MVIPKPKSSALKAAVIPFVIIFSVLIFYHEPYTDSKLTGYDNLEWYEGTIERDGVANFLDINFVSTKNKYYHSTYYNPVQFFIWNGMISYFDNFAFPYKVLGILIHTINTLLVLAFIRLFIKNRAYSFAVAFSFFLFYPNHQTVGWIAAALTTGLSAFFILSTLLMQVCYFKTGNKLFYGAALILFATGIFTKEYVVFAALLVFLYYILLHRKRSLAFIKGDLVLLPYVLIPIPLILITLIRIQNSALVNIWGGFNFGINMVYRFVDLFTYLVVPVSLSIGAKMGTSIFVILIVPILLYLSRKDKCLMFLVLSLFILIAIFTYSNFRDIYTLERYLYLPSVMWFSILYYLALNIKNNIGRVLSALFLVGYTIIFNILLIIT
ncbi:MAG: hypothetical protein K9M03_03175 [Kiritimatiellales bacterium]|nr:hypothetical protein [Kiritimatiellales bacterium]